MTQHDIFMREGVKMQVAQMVFYFKFPERKHRPPAEQLLKGYSQSGLG
jgi:hypothetical protein